MKTLFTLPILFRHPLEFYDRVVTFFEVRLTRFFGNVPPKYKVIDVDEAVKNVGKVLGDEASHFLNELPLSEIENWVDNKIKKICSNAPFPLVHNADTILAKFSYLFCRLLKPTIVLETGVAYGMMSAFILQALEVNKEGILYSIDLPPLGRDADRFVGILIPDELKARWRLNRGVSKRILPRLLPVLGSVDLFIHDSLHTYRNMKREFHLVTPYLSPKAAVISDDIDSNTAFKEWMMEVSPEYWTIIKEEAKESLFGVAIKLNAYPFDS